jgi:hypothetical protein
MCINIYICILFYVLNILIKNLPKCKLLINSYKKLYHLYNYIKLNGILKRILRIIEFSNTTQVTPLLRISCIFFLILFIYLFRIIYKNTMIASNHKMKKGKIQVPKKISLSVDL